MVLSELPRIGLGTFSNDDERWDRNVRDALHIGYRHIDTAEAYGNESAVGEGIQSSAVDRDDVFLATKTVHFRTTTDIETIDDSITGCVDRLNVEYVDLLYVHWPGGVYEHETVLPIFEAARRDGRTRHVGVSNFTPSLIEEAFDVLDAPIVAHQVEMHPLLQQRELLAHAQENDYWIVAYSPLAKGRVFELPDLRDIAVKHDVTPASVSLAWLLSKENVAVIPKASSVDHMRANLAAMDLDLDADDLDRIEGIEREERLVDPDVGPWNA